jgi:hypothetical protein
LALEEVGTVAKKAVGPLIVIFAVFFLLTQPANAAGAVEVVSDALGECLTAISRFLTALIS